MTLVDARAREQIRTQLHGSQLIEAAAGTGKTTELVERMVACLRTGACGPEGLVALTFTRAAAGELKLRLRQRLHQACAEADLESEDHRRLRDAVRRLDEAQVGTIHGFCVDLLRRYPLQADLDPGFEELSETGAVELFDAQMRRWFEEALDRPSLTLMRALRWPSSKKGDDNPYESLRAAAWSLCERRHQDAPWRRPEEGPRRADLVQAAQEVSSHLEAGAQTNATRKLTPIMDFARREIFRSRSDEQALTAEREADLFEMLKGLPPSVRLTRKWSADISGPQLEAKIQALMSGVKTYQEVQKASFAVDLRELLSEPIQRYQDEKRRRSLVDFNDLLIRTKDLLKDAAIRERLRAQVQRLFVDEFQDTDPLQTEILEAVCPPESGKLTLVGDPKQSIYGWRTADMAHYLEVRQRLEDVGVERLELRHSFRAVDALQVAVNAVFQPVFDQGEGQPGYVPLDGGGPSVNDASVVLLRPPRTMGKAGRWTREQVRESWPQGVAHFVQWLLHDSSIQVRDPRDGSWRRPRASDVGILKRGIRASKWGQDETARLTDALEALNVPFSLLGRQPVNGREEVEALHMVLSALEWPSDPYRTYASLRGPLFGFTDQNLYRYQQARGSLSIASEGSETAEAPHPELQTLQRALDFLADLSRQRNQRAPAQTLHALFDGLRTHGAFAHTERGEVALSLIRHAELLAHVHESERGGAFRRFVERLEDFQEHEYPDIATHDQVEGVRIMSSHAAKGLEFPVVVLADPLSTISKRSASSYSRGNLAIMELCGCLPVDMEAHQAAADAADRAEGHRLAYVACTRARDLLVLVQQDGVGDSVWHGPWHSAMQGLRGPESCWGLPDGPVDDLSSQQSGKFNTPLGPVVFLPSQLTGGPLSLRCGVTDPDALAEGPGSRAGRDLHAEWLAQRAQRRESGEVPRMLVMRASRAEYDPPETVGAIQEIELPIDVDRPGGARFGELVHGLLQGHLEQRNPDAEMWALRLGATDMEREAAVRAVRAALDHPVVAAARGATESFREWPLTTAVDGEVLESVVDLLYRDQDGSWVVVDFKTDRDLRLEVERHRTQMRWYLYGLHHAGHRPVRGVILRV